MKSWRVESWGTEFGGTESRVMDIRLMESMGIELEIGKWGTNHFLDCNSTQSEGFDSL